VSSIAIEHATVWPAWDAEPIPDASVLVENGRFVRVGRFRARADVIVDAEGALAMPGLIQTHVHLCQTLFRGLGEGLPLLDWLRHVVWPCEAAHGEASVAASARLACAEMIRGGVVAVATMETVRWTEVSMGVLGDAGLGGLVGHCWMDRTGGYEPLAVELDEFLTECDALHRLAQEWPDLDVAVAPRFALSCSPDGLIEVAKFAQARQLHIHTHASETTAEVQWVFQRTGRRNVEFLDECGLLDPRTLLAHCVHLDPAERLRLAERGCHVVHCPTANLKLGSGLAPIVELLQEGISVALGSDGAPCNNRLDLFEEMRLAGLIQGVRVRPGALSAREVVRMATEAGAAALGWAGRAGRIEPGYRADLVLLDVKDPSWVFEQDPATAVVYSGHSGVVELTMAAGRILYENGQFLTLDIERVVKEARTERERLLRRAGLT
jgi:cytosine/adenosine deaminase-related metal-dependent hydrolase